MSEDNHQEKKLPRESIDEFCKRLGIRIVNEKGGVEFVPYRGKASRIKISKRRSGARKTLYVEVVLRSGSSLSTIIGKCAR